jgi:hypothetical protein
MDTPMAAERSSRSEIFRSCSVRVSPRIGWRKRLLTVGMESAMATVKTYDQRCYDLAMEFLKDESDLFSALHVHSLALEIQQCIEDEIYFMRAAPELYPFLKKTPALLHEQRQVE